MNKEEVSAKKILQLEMELNKTKFKGVWIGSLMAIFLSKIFNNTLNKRVLRHFASVIYFHFKAIKPKPRFKDLNKSVLYFKTGVHRHYKSMEDAVISDNFLKDQTLVVGPPNHCSISAGFVFGSFSFGDLIKGWSFLVKNGFPIWIILKDFRLSKIERTSLLLMLFCQLAKVQSLVRFFASQKNSIKLIGGDFDRGAESAVWFAVAKTMGFRSFTLQHGVINPPYGYNPLIADEIWVWGEMAKKQLILLCVNESQIKVVGTPILNKIEISDNKRQAVINRLKLKDGVNVVLALSTPNPINDRKLVNFLKEVKNMYGGPNDNFFVKLHPARKTKDFQWVSAEFGIELLPNPMDQSEFMNLADILLAHSSGITIEAFYYGIKIGILDILPVSPGNGLEIHKYFDVSLIRKVSDFERVLSKNYFHFKDQVYYAIGKKAENNIKELIYEKLHS